MRRAQRKRIVRRRWTPKRRLISKKKAWTKKRRT